MNKEFRNTVKFLKKNKNTAIKTIIPVVIFCLLVTIIGILSPKPNDNITPSNTYLFENRNPDFNVGFGNKEYPDKSFVRFEAKVDNSNPFENEESNLWDRVKGIFTTKKQGFEFGLTEVRFDDTESESSSNIFTNIADAVKDMEVDDVSTDTEVIEVGRLLGEQNEESMSKKTVINKDVYPGVDLEYQILENLGVKEEIVIRDIDAYTSDCGDDRECLVPLNKFVFNLRLDEGLQLKKSLVHIRGKSDTKYYITDSDNNYIAHFLPTFAVDGVGSKTTDVDLEISHIQDNNYKVVVILNLDWLFSTDRVFPIRIDPSIVHDTTTEFDTGYDYNTEVVTGPKVQLQEAEGDVVDSTVEGLWHMDKVSTVIGGSSITVSGGTETTYGDYTIHTFTSGGTFSSDGTISVDALIVAGGGGGGNSGGSGGGGGGGAGGLIFNEDVEIVSGNYSVVVGGGGSGGSTGAGGDGGNSSFNSSVAIGGGGGASGSTTPNDGRPGGSGGGARGYVSGVGGAGTSGQGYDGGDSLNSGTGAPAGGGGGAGSVGGDSSSSVAGNGGSGQDMSSYYGTGVGASGLFAGGGGGGRGSAGTSGGTATAGGGAGGLANNPGTSATANTGGGGGGGGSNNTNGGSGGSGVVIIRYLTSSLSGTSDTVEDYSSNGNDGTISGATHTLEGKYHGAMYFDGTDDYIEVDNDSSLQLTNDFTIALWVYRTGEGGGTWPRILSKSSASGSFDYSVQVTETYGSIPGDHIMFAITKSDTNTHWVVSSRELEFNRWTHIVCTIDSSNNLKLYMDGEDVSGLTDGTVGAARSTTSNLQFGRLGDNGGWHYSYVGYIDEILIMSDAISADDAARLYTNGYESVVQGTHTSASLNLTESSDIESITWTPVGDDTGDGETVYSTTNLIGQWNFNETSGTTADNVGSCGSSCDATLYNMTTTGQDAGVGTGWTKDNRRWGEGALMFDGTNDYAYVTSNSNLRPTNNFTVEAWVNTNEISGTQTIIKHSENGGGDDAWGFGITDAGELTFSAANTGDDQFIVSNEILRPGEWYYVVGVYDNSTLKLYINGKLDKTQTASGNVVYEVTDYVIIGKRGGTASPNTCYFNGTIDSIRFYTRVLSATEILSNYQSGNIEMRYRTSTDGSTWTDWSGEENDVESYNNPYLYENNNDDAGTGLVSYWQLDETTGTSVADSFGSNTGTATGTTIVDGKYSKARDFNGSSDYVNVSHATNISFERTDSFTLSAWVKTSSTATLQTIISKMSNSAPYTGYDLSINDGHLVFDLIGTWDTSAIQKYSRTDINDGRWHYVAATYDGSSDADGINLYIDGYPDENPGIYVDNLTTTTQQTTNLRIGSRVGGGYFDGFIDEARVYNTELSRSAIYNEYAEGLISYWKMDETSGSTAVDFVGTNDGTASGTTIVDAKYGKGRSFNGTSDYIEVTNDSSLELSSNFTLSTWIYRDTDSGTYERIMSKSDGTDYDYYMQIDDSDHIMCGVHTINANGNSQRSSSTISTGEWTHVTCVFYSDYTWDVYINGELDNGTTAGVHEPANTSSKNLQFGRVSDSSVWYYSFDGKIDDFKIYDRALTESEVQNEHLVGYWSMEELSGSTVYDVTGDDHGTATGTTIEEGKHGNARWFDGDDKIVSSSTTTMEPTEEFTISAWVYATSIPSVSTEGRTVASKWDWVSATETYGWNFGAIYSGPFFQFSVSDGGHSTNQIIEDQEFFTHHLNEWVHMVGVFKASNYLKLYRNGELIDEMTSGVHSTVPYTTDDPFTIGARSKDTQSYWDGGIDEVKYYEKALSEESIKQLFSEGSTKPESLRTRSVDETIEGSRALQIETDGPIIDGNTVGYWTLDETGGSSAYIKDSSGNQNGSTPYNTTYIKEGKIGGARDFNGTSSLIDVGWSSNPSNNFTLEAWFTVDSTHEIDTESTSGTAGGSGQKYLFYPIYHSDGGVGVSVGTNGISVYEHSSSYLPALAVYEADIPDGWNHVAVVYIDKTPSIYLNGAFVHEGLTSPRTNVYVTCDFGGDGGTGDYGYHDGMIDEIRISDISRSAEEILESYNLGKYRYTTKSISSADISDDSYLPFWVASEDLGHNLDLIYGNSPYANYQPDENTVGLWHMDQNIDPPSASSPTGGTITTDGGYTIHTFTSSGTFSVPEGTVVTIDAVAIGGGGGGEQYTSGGSGGGGGGLGWMNGIPLSGGDYTVTVGTGGSADSNTGSTCDATDGGESYFMDRTVVRGDGGGAAAYDTGGIGGAYKGDGGGNGGDGATSTTYAGGGGGAGGYTGDGGDGGDGDTSSAGSNGSGGGGGGGAGGSSYDAGGGGGGTDPYGSGTSGTGGSWTYADGYGGGGGSGGDTGGGYGNLPADGGLYGGGGGGADNTYGEVGDGGDGVVVVKYLTDSFKPEGTVLDSSGNSYHGIPEGTTYQEEAKLGGGRYFDGSDDKITLSDNSLLNFGTSDFTIEAWVKSEMGSTIWPGVVSKTGGSPLYGYQMLITGSTSYDTAIWQIWSNGTQASVVSDVNVRDGQWHHLVGVKTSSQVIIYIDGVLNAVAGHSLGSISQTTTPFTIGKCADSTSSTEGIIDEVRVSDVARTADEIRQAYEVGRRTHPITIDFRADLESGNLITGSTDLSFTISEQDYGTTDHIENIDVGETIVVKENYGGTEYFAQGEVATVNTSTGAVTVSSWDNGSTFPTSGFTANAIVYKWQREYVDIRYPLDEDINGINTLTFRKTSSVGTKFWIDDAKRATYSSDYAGTSFETIEGVQYVQYRPVFSTWDDNRELDLYLSEVDIEYSSGPTMDQIMRHGKWFNSSGEEQPFWWVQPLGDWELDFAASYYYCPYDYVYSDTKTIPGNSTLYLTNSIDGGVSTVSVSINNGSYQSWTSGTTKVFTNRDTIRIRVNLSLGLQTDGTITLRENNVSGRVVGTFDYWIFDDTPCPF